MLLMCVLQLVKVFCVSTSEVLSYPYHSNSAAMGSSMTLCDVFQLAAADQRLSLGSIELLTDDGQIVDLQQPAANYVQSCVGCSLTVPSRGSSKLYSSMSRRVLVAPQHMRELRCGGMVACTAIKFAEPCWVTTKIVQLDKGALLRVLVKWSCLLPSSVISCNFCMKYANDWCSSL